MKSRLCIVKVRRACEYATKNLLVYSVSAGRIVWAGRLCVGILRRQWRGVFAREKGGSVISARHYGGLSEQLPPATLLPFFFYGHVWAQVQIAIRSKCLFLAIFLLKLLISTLFIILIKYKFDDQSFLLLVVSRRLRDMKLFIFCLTSRYAS